MSDRFWRYSVFLKEFFKRELCEIPNGNHFFLVSFFVCVGAVFHFQGHPVLAAITACLARAGDRRR